MAAVPRHHPAIVISIVVAATAVTACALVAIASMLGWVPTRAAPVATKSAPAPKSAASNELALLPGETVVNDEPRPVTPQYAKPAPAKPTEAARPAEAPPAKSARSAKQEPPRRTAARPTMPAYERPAPRPNSYDRSARNFCVNCGTVLSISAYEMGEWLVRVRFEDGSMETLRYRERPQLRIGQSVLLEEGRLIPQ